MKKKRRLIIFIVFAILLIVFTFKVPTVAKFVTDKISSYFLRTKYFYFTSDLLSENNASYTIGTWSGVGPFDVSFNLFSKDNELLYTENDIEYTITFECSSDVTCTSNRSSGTLYQTDADHSDNVVISVNPQRVFVADETVSVRVTAKSTSPYVKTLTGEFNYLVGKDGVSYEIVDEAGQPYLFLKVTNDTDYCIVREAFGSYSLGDMIGASEYRLLSASDQNKCVSKYLNVSFDPRRALLDSTSDILNNSTYTTTTIGGVSYVNSFVYKVAPSSAFQIKFYKIDPLVNNSATVLTNNSILVVSTSD